MDNEQFSQGPAESSASGGDDSQDSEGGGSSERIFDITADLNISPVDDTPVAPVTPASAQSAPISISISPNLIPSKPTPKPVSSTTVPPAPISSPVPPVSVTQKAPVQSIPLQDFSASLQKAGGMQSSQAAPAMKVMPSPAEMQAKINVQQAMSSAQSLQDAIAPTQPIPAPVVQNPNLKPLRTYEGDVAEVMSRKRTSTTSIAIAESRRNEGTESIKAEPQQAAPSRHTASKLFIILLSLILIGGGVVGAYYLYSISPLAPAPITVQPQAQVSASLIPSDSRTTISVDNLDPLKITAQVRAEIAKPQPAGTIREIIFTKSTDGQVTRVSGPEMLNMLDIPAPDVLARSLTAPWMLGIYADQSGQKSVFVVVTTNFFQNAFAGMLQWESVMADDLKQYLYSGPAVGIANIPQTNTPLTPVATTTATSTNKTASSTISQIIQTIAPYFTLRGKFHDRIIKNKDVREFVTDDNQVLFLYSFLDNNKLTITGNEATLSEMISRLEKQAFVR